MIIDSILDRFNGVNYNSRNFYHLMMEYGSSGSDYGYKIAEAMDYGTEKDVKDVLKLYITDNDYNPNIKRFIDMVDWLTEGDEQKDWSLEFDLINHTYPKREKAIQLVEKIIGLAEEWLEEVDNYDVETSYTDYLSYEMRMAIKSIN